MFLCVHFIQFTIRMVMKEMVYMSDLFLIIFMLSLVAVAVFVLMAIVQFVKKDSAKGKKQLKFTGISVVVMIAAFIGFGVTTDSTETTEGKEVTEKVEETTEEKAAREAKEAEEKALAEQKTKEEERLQAEQEKANRKQLAVKNASEITFPMLNKAADRYAGSPYYVKGEVVQALEEGNYTIMRVNMTQNSWGWTDTVWVEYADITDAVEGSIIEIYGEIIGSHTYDTTIGGSMTIPAILADEVNVLQ